MTKKKRKRPKDKQHNKDTIKLIFSTNGQGV